MNAPAAIPTKEAPRKSWPQIALMFQHGFDTYKIAFFLGFSEASIYNALHRMREEARAAK